MMLQSGQSRSAALRTRKSGKAALRPVRHPVFLAVLALLLALALVGAAILRAAYNRTLAEGRNEAQMLARLLKEQTLRNFQAVDLVLQGMVETVSAPLPENDANFRAVLQRRLKHVPHVRALFVIGADGFIVHDTDYPETPRVSLADRSYFLFHRDNPNGGLHIGSPLLSRSVGRWFVSVSRVVTDPDGRFAGVAVAAVEPGFYNQSIWASTTRTRSPCSTATER